MRDEDSTEDQLTNELAEMRQRIAELEASETERTRAEEALQELLEKVERAKQEWESTADSLPELVCLLDDRGRIIRANRTVESWNLAPVEDVRGRGFHELLHPGCTAPSCYLDAFWQETWKEQNPDRPAECEAYDQVLKRHVLVRVQPRRNRRKRTESGSTVAIVCDITQRKRAEGEKKELQAQLLHAQKMEAVGRLASGVAHDFNNLLTAIIGYSQLLLSELAPDDPRRMDVQEILKVSRRATSLTDQLLAFSRQQPLQPQVLNLNELLTDMEKMLRCLNGRDAELITILDPALRHVKVDPGQMGQVIMNLAVNARDAMPQGGKLTIETRNVSLGEEQGAVPPEAEPGPFVCLSVTDTGGGMDEETLQHLFEPFFTTKANGTGLGLSVAYGIVQQHKGWIRVDSKLGQGSTFEVYLSALAPEAAQATEEMAPLQGFSGAWGEGVPRLPCRAGEGGRAATMQIDDDEGVGGCAARVPGDGGHVQWSRAQGGGE